MAGQVCLVTAKETSQAVQVPRSCWVFSLPQMQMSPGRSNRTILDAVWELTLVLEGI